MLVVMVRQGEGTSLLSMSNSHFWTRSATDSKLVFVYPEALIKVVLLAMTLRFNHKTEFFE